MHAVLRATLAARRSALSTAAENPFASSGTGGSFHDLVLLLLRAVNYFPVSRNLFAVSKNSSACAIKRFASSDVSSASIP